MNGSALNRNESSVKPAKNRSVLIVSDRHRRKDSTIWAEMLLEIRVWEKQKVQKELLKGAEIRVIQMEVPMPTTTEPGADWAMAYQSEEWVPGEPGEVYPNPICLAAM